MRITNSMMTGDYLSSLNGNLNRMSKYLEQESTGKAINSISDNPVKTTQSLSARNKLSGIKRYKENVRDADNWMTEVEESVSQLNDVIQDAYELCVGASSETYNSSDRSIMAKEIAALRDEVLSTANSTFGDSYLFAGYNTTGASSGEHPFTVDARGDLYYNGINMSNEASLDKIDAAVDTAAKALNDATAADTTAQGANLSERNKIIASIKEAAGYIQKLSDAAGTAAESAADLAGSSGVSGTTMEDLLLDASGTSQTAADDAAEAASNALTLVNTAQSAVDAEEEAYAAWQQAIGTDGETDAHNTYLVAQSTADTALQDALTASTDALTEAGTAKTAVDTINAMVDADDSIVSAKSSVTETVDAAQAAFANSDYSGVADAATSAVDFANAAAQAAQVFANASSVIGAAEAGDIANAISTLQTMATAATTAAAAVVDGPTATTAMNAIDDVQTAINDLETYISGYVDGYDEQRHTSAALDTQSDDVLSLQVGTGQTMSVTVPGTQLLGRGDENLYVILDELHSALTSGADGSVIKDFVTRLQNGQGRVLAIDAEVGAKMQRINSLSARYDANTLNYTQMKSDAEDADMAEVIMNYKTAQTVYNAALSAGSEIIQTSLIDFLR